jgi:hypothetical protein
MRKLLMLFAICALAVLLGGCCCCSGFSTGITKSTFVLDSNTYKKWDIPLTDNGKLSYSVTANGQPVDVLIMDEQNFNLFRENSYHYQALVDTNNTAVSGDFPAPGEGTYYFVVYNDGDSANTISLSLNW